jgi:hypothetical protein
MTRMHASTQPERTGLQGHLNLKQSIVYHAVPRPIIRTNGNQVLIPTDETPTPPVLLRSRVLTFARRTNR